MRTSGPNVKLYWNCVGVVLDIIYVTTIGIAHPQGCKHPGCVSVITAKTRRPQEEPWAEGVC